MGLGEFFQGAWNKVRKVGGKIGGAIKGAVHTVGKITKPVMNIISGVSGFLQGAPGKVGKIAGAVRKGVDTAKKLINLLPDSNFKKRLEEGSDKAEQIVRRGEQVVGDVVEKGREYAPFIDKVGELVQRGGEAVNRSNVL